MNVLFSWAGKLGLIASAFLLATTAPVRGEIDPKFYAVMVSAQVQTSPAQITLQWTPDSLATGYSIARKNGNSWSTVATVGGGVNSWTDSNVAVGSAYEYRVVKSTSASYKGTGYILAGINAPLKDTRGRVILLVDNLFSTDLAAELTRLQWDLAGDGWTVVRRDVSRNDSVQNIKSIVKGLWEQDKANTKAVFLFGHIPVPYSGNFAPDFHGDHVGAWPADMFYGDMDGSWSDQNVNNSGASKPWNHNRPNDGKFDQSNMPSDIELAVGRVDMHNLTCFSNKAWSRSEKDLLRAYLNKDHNFRHRVFTVARRGLVCDNFGEREGEAFASSGFRNFAPFFGGSNITPVGYGRYFSTLGGQDYLWSYGTGGGSWTTCNGVGGSDDFALTEVKSVFTMFLGSYFGDYDNESNFLRAALGSGYVLTTSWAGRPHWFYHHMGLGEHIGASVIFSQNNGQAGPYEGVNIGTRQVHAGFLGDPTLRMHPVIPPSNLNGSASGSSITLTWSPSSDTDLHGYHVYRGGSPESPFTRLTASPISATAFTDHQYSQGTTYMVRAVKLERSGSGTYFNSSQGVFYPANNNVVTPQPAPAAATGLAATAEGSSRVNLTWTDNAQNENGFRIERKSGNGNWAQVGLAGANSTSYSNTGLSPNTTYTYRVLAYNNSGNSAPSNESTATTSGTIVVPSVVEFVGTDTATKGNWKGVYGKDGYNIIGNSVAYPGYVNVTPAGKTDYQWTTSTTDTRALQKVTDSSRVAACWYSDTTYTIDLNFTDGLRHKFSLYFLDWDRSGRSQKVELLDPNNTVLDTQTVSGFGEGTYLSWNVQGAVRVRLTRLSGFNAVAMGLFFDGALAASNPSLKVEPLGWSGGNFKVRITGETGTVVDLYSSADLRNWTKRGTITLSSATSDFLDTSSSGAGPRFYRVSAAP